VDVSASDVREVRFGTTRVRAGYDIKEVDEFLDRVEKAIAAYAENDQRVRDEADALRSQVQQIQGRLELAQAELAEARTQAAASSTPPSQVTPIEGEAGARESSIIEDTDSSSMVVMAADDESTAENPVVVSDVNPALAELGRVRDDVRAMLEQQLALVDAVQVPQRSG
jgi:DivIVA domain-containing protein